MLAELACLVALQSVKTPHLPEGTTIVCQAADEYPNGDAPTPKNIAGWYNGNLNEITIVQDLDPAYIQDVLVHEIGHAYDLKLGTLANGYPAFFSTTYTRLSAEEYAHLFSWYLGYWPIHPLHQNREPTPGEISAMQAAGWLPADPARPPSGATPVNIQEILPVGSAVTEVTPAMVALPAERLTPPIWSAPPGPAGVLDATTAPFAVEHNPLAEPACPAEALERSQTPGCEV